MLKQLLLALKRLLRALGPVLVGCIFLGAVYLLYREISKYSLADIRMSLAQISTGSIILSVLLAIINYIILTGWRSKASTRHSPSPACRSFPSSGRP